MHPIRHLLLACVLYQVSSFLPFVNAGQQAASPGIPNDVQQPPPNFKDIIQQIANVSSSSTIDETLSQLTPDELFNDASYMAALLEIGIKHPSILSMLSTVVLNDGTMAFNVKTTTKKLAEAQSSTSSDLLKIVIDSIKLSEHGENIDYKALGNNPLISQAGLPIPYPMLSAIIDIKGVMKAVSVKDFISGYLVSYSSDQNSMIQNYIDFNELLRQVKPENLAKNQLLKSLLTGMGIPGQLIDIIAGVDSNKLTKAIDFDQIAKAYFKYQSGNGTTASVMKLTKTILGNINFKEVANQLDVNTIVDLALNQTQIIDSLKNLGVSAKVLQQVLKAVDLNDILRVINVGNIMNFNGTIFQLPTFILNNIDLNNILPDVNLKSILKIPQIAKLLNQSSVDPELVQTVIESVDLNEFLQAIDLSKLARDLMVNTDQDYVKVLLNNTNVDKLILSINVDKLFSHPAIEKLVREKLNMDPMIAKLLLKNVKVDQLLKAIDTKAISKMLVNSVNGTYQSMLVKAMDMVNIDKILESIDITKFVDNDKVKELLKQYGIDPIILEIVTALDLNEILTSLKIDSIIKQAILTGNFNIKDIMQQIMKKVDLQKIIGKLDWKKLIKEVSKGKMTSLPLSLECAVELGKIAIAANSSGSGMAMLENPVVKMFDAWGKPQSRIAFGNLFWLGAYDECKSIPTAKYCISQISLGEAVPYPLLHGSCIPKRCTEKDFKVMLDFAGVILVQTLSTLNINLPTQSVELKNINCQEEVSYTTGFTITLAITTVFVVLAVLGTILEFFDKPSSDLSTDKSPPTLDVKGIESFELSNSTSQTTLYRDGEEENRETVAKQPKTTEHPIKNFLYCFSIPKNIATIMATSSPKGAIRSINGMRVISITWVIIGHIYMALFRFPIDNGLEAKKLIHEYAMLPFLNGHVAVDTFFLLSGLLVAYLTFKQMKKTDGKINVPLFYLHRFLRLTPVYMYVLLVWTNVAPYLLFGPAKVLGMEKTVQKRCYDYWWSNLLYINNFYPQKMENMCMTWTWYLANDMQFYFLAPPILIAMYKLRSMKNGKRSSYGPFALIGLLCFVSLLITAILIGVFDLAMVNSETRVEGNPRTKNGGTDSVYTKPHTRIVPYLIGLLLGYMFVNDISLGRHPKRKILNFVGWVLSLLIGYAIVYGPSKTYKDPPEFLTGGEELLYGTFFRLLWSLCIAFVIFSCQHKLGGPVNTFLSWSGWIPLCRLSYGAYLLHPLPVLHFQGLFDNPLHYQDGIWVYYIIALVVMTFAVSFLLALFVEFPIMNLEKLAIGGGKKKDKK